MSAAATTADAAAPKGGGKKKLVVVLTAVLLLVLVGGGAAVFLLKKKAHGEDDEGAEPAAEQGTEARRDSKAPPAYVPLDMFVVNLADREAERYAQVGITLEMVDAKEAEGLKVFMPAIRNNILMVLAHKTAADLLEREGKVKLAGEVQRAAARGLGIQVAEPSDSSADKAPKKKAPDADAGDEDEKPKKRKPARSQPLPIIAVHFSSFIVQ